jgi:hypothetical protein
MSFDQAYYKRYYYDASTAVTTRREMEVRARLIASLTEHVGVPPRHILDAGAGVGMLRSSLKRLLPKAEYVCLETSEYLCQRYGWEHGRIEDYRSDVPFDLLICYDVLQYLDAASASRALVNFGRLCCGVLYFSALTKVDWDWNCDPERTDAAVHLRSALWYRRRLHRNFREIGAGFWLRRGAHAFTWELECVS